jgi:EmrB/QacA subfamily drug resistance transporter
MQANAERLDRSTIVALGAMGVAVLVIANDFTALSVALPAIEHDLDAELSTVQWVINAYALVFGVAIVTGGRLADMLGRRRMFVLGAAIFAFFSALGGAAQGAGWLIACRAAMGIGGAFMWPAILGMTYAILPRSKAGLAGGLILGAAGFGNAIGPLVGGLLTELLSWRWIFFVNVPIAALAVLLTVRAVPRDTPEAGAARLDYAGTTALSAGLLALLLALDQSSTWGWGDLRTLALLAACPLLLAIFVLIERRAGESALIPRDVIANRAFSSACLAVLLMSAVFFAALLYLPQFMTKVLGYSALKAGAGLAPMMCTFAAASFIAGPLYGRVGPKLISSAGAVCIALGVFQLSRLDASDGYAALVPGMIVLGIGIGLFYSSITTAAVTALDPSRSSLGGGIVYMFQVAGGAVGLGLNTAIVTSGAEATLDGLVNGIGDAFRLDAALAALAVVVVVWRVQPPRSKSPLKSKPSVS